MVRFALARGNNYIRAVTGPTAHLHGQHGGQEALLRAGGAAALEVAVARRWYQEAEDAARVARAAAAASSA